MYLNSFEVIRPEDVEMGDTLELHDLGTVIVCGALNGRHIMSRIGHDRPLGDNHVFTIDLLNKANAVIRLKHDQQLDEANEIAQGIWAKPVVVEDSIPSFEIDIEPAEKSDEVPF